MLQAMVGCNMSQHISSYRHLSVCSGYKLDMQRSCVPTGNMKCSFKIPQQQTASSLKVPYLQWTTMGIPFCDVLMLLLSLMSLMMSVRS